MQELMVNMKKHSGGTQLHVCFAKLAENPLPPFLFFSKFIPTAKSQSLGALGTTLDRQEWNTPKTI